MPVSIADYAARRPKSFDHRRSILLKYIQYLAKNPNMALPEAEAYVLDYLQLTPEKQAGLMLDYLDSLKATRTPATANCYITTIRDWHTKNKIRFDDDFADEIRRNSPPNYAITEDESLTVEKIRAICSHADPLLKAFILAACSSGARIGELLSLNVGDIEYLDEYDVYSFRLAHTQTKAGKPHRYFISHEAMQAIDDFMRVRPQYLSSQKIKAERCLHKEAQETQKLFILVPSSIRAKLDGATKKAGLHSVDKQSGRSRIHPHSFRKFADTQFKEVVGINMGNELIGHDEGLSKSYRRYDMRQKTDAYRKIEPFVTIQAPGDYVQIKSRLGGEMEKMQATVAGQSLEIAELKKRLEYTEIKLEIAKRHTNF